MSYQYNQYLDFAQKLVDEYGGKGEPIYSGKNKQ